MKRYFLYAIILGALGHSLLDTGSHYVAVNNTTGQLAKLGE